MQSQTVRILVVDDEEVNLRLMEGLLSLLGYETLLAHDGIEGLALAKKERPDLVLLDVMMPGMDGFEVCRELRADPETAFIPIVIVTALGEIEHRIKGIEAGADDFLTKPVNHAELSARTCSLLKARKLREDLENAYRAMDRLVINTEQVLHAFNPLSFDEQASERSLVEQLLTGVPAIGNRPRHVFLGTRQPSGKLEGLFYASEQGVLSEHRITMAWDDPGGQDTGLVISNWQEEGTTLDAYQQRFASELREAAGRIENLVAAWMGQTQIIALNYLSNVSHFDAEALKSLGVHAGFLKTIGKQIQETENAFLYTIHALARAAELNDEDTGDHILRVNEYSRVLAEAIGLTADEVKVIHYSAQMHDVGKIHIHPDLLRKPGKLTPEEWKIMRTHTTAGTKILGDAPRLAASSAIALGHHERWDGSGYPRGLKGEAIALPARIVTVGDVYDALRMARSYKPAFPHEKAYEIITVGDERTAPEHFDPRVLAAFKARVKDFEGVYEAMRPS